VKFGTGYLDVKRLRRSRGCVLAFSTQVRGFKPGRSRRIFKGKKILSTPSFGGEVKPLVPCRRFSACKSRQFGKITGQHSRPQFHIPSLGSLTSWRTWRKLERLNAGESNSKLPLRICPGCSVLVVWLSFDLCPDRPKGWIPIIIIIIIIIIYTLRSCSKYSILYSKEQMIIYRYFLTSWPV
jgi:hypothetical protein